MVDTQIRVWSKTNQGLLKAKIERLQFEIATSKVELKIVRKVKEQNEKQK